MARQRLLLGVIFALVIAAVVVIVQIPTRLGLDLRGGSQLTLQVQPTPERPEISARDLEGVQRVVEGRVNGLGVSEAIVQELGNNQLLVQLPGISDPQQAERVLGGTAQLEFRAQKPGTEQQFLIENQVRQGHQQELDAFQKSQPEGVPASPEDQTKLEALRKAVTDSDAAIATLFEPAKLTGDSKRAFTLVATLFASRKTVSGLRSMQPLLSFTRTAARVLRCSMI